MLPICMIWSKRTLKDVIMGLNRKLLMIRTWCLVTFLSIIMQKFPLLSIISKKRLESSMNWNKLKFCNRKLTIYVDIIHCLIKFNWLSFWRAKIWMNLMRFITQQASGSFILWLPHFWINLRIRTNLKGKNILGIIDLLDGVILKELMWSL